MALVEKLNQSATACEGAALALAHALRPQATKAPGKASAIVETFHEAEAFAITCRAVMEELQPVLPLLQKDGPVVGKQPLLVTTSVANGFDSLALVLVTLFDAANNAILDVAGNRTRWIKSLPTNNPFERMSTHHGQLRAMYGIIHLAGKIVSNGDVTKSLFIDVSGAKSELQPAKWRSAIKMDHFYGRYFGFHYTPEMRNVLRIVNIARRSVQKSHCDNDASPQLVKNAAMVGWGWVYSNMLLMDNIMGIKIDGVSQIGADTNKVSVSELRKFMNLIEEPLLAGVSSIASSDVAIDCSFQIPTPGATEWEQFNAWHCKELEDILASIVEPVSVRLMSKQNRLIDLKGLKGKGALTRENSRAARRMRTGDLAKKETYPRTNSKSNNNNTRVDGARLQQEGMQSSSGGARGSGLQQRTGNENSNESCSNAEIRQGASLTDQSYLASTIKTELSRLQSNISLLLGYEEAAPAKCLVLHFHGGGFISQSSTSHQAYLKEWCADLPDTVLVTVDYKLSPEHRFPVALHECVYAYIWAVTNANRVGCMAEKVVLSGDSAGGNLAIATAMLINEMGLRKPDGICVGYPALYLNNAWSPSRLLSFFDPMLPLSVLNLCMEAYLPENMMQSGTSNALISPLLCEEEKMKALPRISIVCGSLDPLLDDAAVFCHRLKQCGRTGDMLRIYESMPHGFLNMSQVNVTARRGMRFLANRIADCCELELKGDCEYEDESGNLARAKAATALFDG